MKNFLMLLTTTYIFAVPLQAMQEMPQEINPSPPKSQKPLYETDGERLIQECRDYYLDDKAYYEDRLLYYTELQVQFKEDIKEKEEIEAIRIFAEKNGIKSTNQNKSLNKQYIELFLDVSIKNMHNVIEIRELLSNFMGTLQNPKEKLLTRIKKGMYYLLQDRLDYLDKRHFRQTQKIFFTPPTYLEYINKEEDEINKEIALSSRHFYQKEMYFLKKFYTLAKTKIDNLSCLAILEGDKGLRDILEEKTKDLGHPDEALKTVPSEKDLDKIIAYWNEKKDNKIPIFVYYERPVQLKEKMIEIVSEEKRIPKIDWDRLSLKNASYFLDQVFYFLPNLTKEKNIQISRYYDKRRNELTKARQEQQKNNAPIKIELKTNKIEATDNKKEINNQSKAIIKEIPEVKGKEERTAPDQPQTVPLPPKQEKNREKRKEEYERRVKKEKRKAEQRKRHEEKKNSEEDGSSDITSEGSDSINSSQSSDHLSQATQNTLSEIFGLTHVKAILWDDCVKTWKELRLVMDGVEAAEPKRSTKGYIYKFHGGPIQDVGKKKKARSFDLHFPHNGTNGYTLGPKIIRRIAEHFQNKFGWTLEKLKEYGFEILTDNNKKQINVEEKTN